jgi:translation elongation factor EF-1beta
MKTISRAIVRISCAAACAALLAFVSANAQQTRRGKLQIESLDRLAPTAAESVNVNLDETLLKIVPPILNDTDKDEKKVKDVVFGLKGVYVRRYAFDNEGAYGEGDIGPIREQLRAPGWQRIVEVRSRREDKKNIEVYLMTEGGRIEALALLSVEPKELTVINIVGSIDLEKLSQLQGTFDIPELDLERGGDRPAPKKSGDAAKPGTAPVLQKP